MKQMRIFILLTALILARDALGNSERVVDLKSSDGTILKGTYFAAGKPGPGVLLFHQSNRTRKSWDELAAQLASVGLHVLTVDSRAHGESGGKYDTEANRAAYWKTWWPSDLDAAFQYLSSQAGVNPGRLAQAAPAIWACKAPLRLRGAIRPRCNRWYYFPGKRCALAWNFCIAHRNCRNCM